jgi:hypothetical protein
MTQQDFLLHLFCLVDDQLQALRLGRLRRRGPEPTLTDSEVIAIELAGEFWSLDTDQRIFRHFRAYHTAEFPALAKISRSNFARQAANLWAVKRLLQERLAERLRAGDRVWLIDSLPVAACQFARATFCRRFRGVADYGYDHVIKRTFYGFRLHLRSSRDGVILHYELAPARINDKSLVAELQPLPGSIGVGDRGYWSPELRDALAQRGIDLHAPYYQKSRDPDPKRSSKLASIRYRIETVNGQLAERFGIKRTWARDLWHLCHRVIRKVLSHTVAVLLNVHQGYSPLQFDALAA